MSSTAIDPRDRAFERLYRRYARDVYRFALAAVRNPAEAEDVTQTAFLNAYRAIKRGDAPERPQSWLIAIAHNAIRSRHRWKLRRPKEVALEHEVQGVSAPLDELPNALGLLAAVAELPEQQRAALAMRELQGQSYDEIADTLGVSVHAVESLVSRARRTLRAQRETLRGLLLALPRSLRGFSQRTDAAEMGVAAKAAAVVAVATVVAGGVGAGAKHTGASAHPRLQASGVSRREAAALSQTGVALLVNGVRRTAVPAAKQRTKTPPAAPPSGGHGRAVPDELVRNAPAPRAAAAPAAASPAPQASGDSAPPAQPVAATAAVVAATPVTAPAATVTTATVQATVQTAQQPAPAETVTASAQVPAPAAASAPPPATVSASVSVPPPAPSPVSAPQVSAPQVTVSAQVAPPPVPALPQVQPPSVTTPKLPGVPGK